MSSDLTFTPTEVGHYYSTRAPGIKQQRVGEWRGPCPLHNGTNDNFAVDSATGNWFCHSVCGRGGDIFTLEAELSGSGNFAASKEAVFQIVGRAVSTTTRNGYHGAPANVPEHAWVFLNQRINQYCEQHGVRHACNYRYTYTDGRLCYIKARFVDADGNKIFQKYALTPRGGWTTPKRAGVQPLLYNLHLLAAADEIHFCNGEKAADAGRVLGLVTTCTPDGEGRWDEQFTPIVKGKPVIVYLDNDAKGRKHGQVVGRALFGQASAVRLVKLPNLPEKGDLYDWIEGGGTADELRKIIESTPLLEALPETAPDEPKRPTQRTANGGLKSTAFRLTDKGVLYIDPDPDKESLIICGRLELAALTRDAKGDGWGRLLKWADAEGRVHEWAMPMSLLAGEGSEYRARLLDGGLVISPGRKARDLLTMYIQTTSVKARALCVSRIGWHEDNFVLPGTTIGPGHAERVLFQTPYESEHLLNVAGTLDGWKGSVGRFCSGNSRLIFAASCAFAGPLLRLAGGESGGVHFVGASSTGKSTALLVGGSVLGGGGRTGFVHSWRTTANGLEATADLHNDLTLFLDELSQMDAREAAEVAYLLANGSGKSRMSRSIGQRKKLTWCLMFVSAGEMTLSDHVQAAGKRVRAGAEVRLLNIDADAGAKMGLFENIHGAKSPDDFARQLTRAALRFYGTPLRAWLEFLTKNRPAVEKALKKSQEDFVSANVPAGASGEVFRAAQRLALIAAAGEFASDAGITGWQKGESTNAAQRCFQSWIDQRGTGGAGDMQAAINQVRRFLEANGSSRFQVIRHPSQAGRDDNPDESQVVRDRAGFRRRNPDNKETEYLVLQETFKSEICAGFDYRRVRVAMADRSFLVREEPHWTVKPRQLPEMPSGTRVYCVRAAILEDAE